MQSAPAGMRINGFRIRKGGKWIGLAKESAVRFVRRVNG
jgi:hypothetical protein